MAKRKKVWEPPNCFYPIYGYQLSEDGRTVPHPTEALVVKAVFKMSAYGLSGEQVADILNILCLPPTVDLDRYELCKRNDFQNCEVYKFCRRAEPFIIPKTPLGGMR